MEGLLLGFGAVFVAELGDKSQLVALAFAARGRPLAVLAGVVAAAGLIHMVSVAAGRALRGALPGSALQVVAGLTFLAFAAWMALRRRAPGGSGPQEGPATPLAAGTAFLVAELGDKTMLAVAALATTYGAVGTWAGATMGTALADALAVAVGHQLGTRLHPRTVGLASAAAFAVVGAVLLLGA